MKYGVIDIGSNSVRLMVSDGENALWKEIKTTRLASKIDDMGNIDIIAAVDTFDAISFFVIRALQEGVDKIYAFATAAVRNAPNSADFVKEVLEKCGVYVEILTGEEEAIAGLVGGLNGVDGGVIDIGGASSEIAISKGGNCVYRKSINIGAVVLTKQCGEDKTFACSIASEKVKNFGIIPQTSFLCVGGTATCLAAVLQGLKVYDSTKIDGYIIKRDRLLSLRDKLYSMTARERKNIVGMQSERADIIQSGATILCSILDYLQIDCVTVSEKDNLEGYLAIKRKTE